MISRYTIFWKTGAHLIFCIAVVIFFGRNSILRMPVCDALYKEYITGVFVLCLFYFDLFVLFPQLYLKNLKVCYLVSAFACAFLFAVGELAYVGPHIKNTLAVTMHPDILRGIMWHYLLFIFLRNLGFVLFAHLLCDIQQQTRLKDLYVSRLREKAQEIQIPTSDTKAIPISVDSILFCQQAKNMTWIYTEDKNCYQLYGSLRKLVGLIGPQDVVYVQRDLIVNRKKIFSYNKQEIVIRNEKNEEVKAFTWTSDFFEKALQTFQPELSQTSQNEGEKLVFNEHPSSQSDKTPLQNHYNLSGSLRSVYKYISRHSNCKVREMTKKLKISSATVNRILKQLKDEGLIEYVGSKKTGGYRVCKK